MPRYYKQKIYTKEQIGWLKGVMEGQAMEQEIINSVLPDYDRRKVQHDIQSFEVMHKRAIKNTQL